MVLRRPAVSFKNFTSLWIKRGNRAKEQRKKGGPACWPLGESQRVILLNEHKETSKRAHQHPKESTPASKREHTRIQKKADQYPKGCRTQHLAEYIYKYIYTIYIYTFFTYLNIQLLGSEIIILVWIFEDKWNPLNGITAFKKSVTLQNAFVMSRMNLDQ